MSQRVFEGVDDFVYELVVGRGVPADPVAHVAPEATAVEERRVIAVRDNLKFPARVAGKVVVG